MSGTEILSGPQVRKLSSGGHLIVDNTFRGAGASVVVLVGTGARDEVAGESGISHFLEHMVFKGTRTRSGMDLTLLFGDLGAQINAYTSDEQTVYYGTVLKSHVDKLHEVLTDMLVPQLDQAEFDVEKKVILEEIALYEDRPNYVLYERAVQDFFLGKGVGQSVLGTTASVSAITSEQMREYVNRRYVRGNVVVSICGDVNLDEFAQLTETRLAALPHREYATSPITSSRSAGAEKIYHHKKNTQAHVLGLAPCVHARHPLRHAAQLVGVMLGDSQNSRLYWQLVDAGLAEHAGLDTEDKDGIGCWMSSFSTTPELFEQSRDKLQEVLRGARGTLTQDELERAKTKSMSRLVMDSELSLGKAMTSALTFQYRKEPFQVERELELLSKVTLEQCHSVLEEFPLDATQLYVMLPE